MNILKFLAGGLFSNTVISKQSKQQKFHVAIIVFILSIVISIIPVFSSVINVSGGDIVTKSESLQFDYSLQRLSSEYLTKDEDAKLKFKIVDGKLVVEKAISDLENKKVVTLKNNEELAYLEIGRFTEENEQITLLVSYVEFNQEKDAATYKDAKAKYEDAFTRLAINYPDKTDDNINKSKVYSTMIFGVEDFSIRLYALGATTEYTVTENDVKLSKTAKISNQLTGLYSSVSINNRNLNEFSSVNQDQILIKWKEFFTESYKDIKTSSLVFGLGYASLFNVVILLLMTLVLFILSRMKAAACGKLSFATCFKLITFASLSPAILSLLLGFILPSFQSIGFLTFVTLRSIFLSTRLTRGEITQDTKR